MFKESAKDLFSNSLLFLFGFMIFVYITVLSNISVFVNRRLTNSFTMTGWFIIFILVLFAGMSYIFSGMLGFSKRILEYKAEWSDFVSYANRFWWRNFFIILLLGGTGILIGRIAHVLSFVAGKSLGFDLLAAQAFFIIIYFAGLVGGLIFLTYSNFFLVIKNLSFNRSIRHSARFVSAHYPQTLALSVIMFVVFFVLSWLAGVFGDLIEYTLLIPFFILVLMRFIILSRHSFEE